MHHGFTSCLVPTGQRATIITFPEAPRRCRKPAGAFRQHRMYFLYSFLLGAGMLLLLPYFLVQGWRHGKYLPSLRQRLGFLPASVPANSGDQGAIWVHGVSVGEVLAALPLAERLKQRFPARRLVISTTTATGQRVARERAAFADDIIYFPLDWRGPVRRAMRAVHPAIVVILETEIWPNFLREMRGAGVPVVFVNGRISDRSFRRYRWLDGFLARVLDDAELFLMQSEEDARRLRELGAPTEAVEVTGNLKYDLPPPQSNPLADWLEDEIRRQERWPVVAAGSVAADEEEAVLAAYDIVQRRWRRALLLLAPRKPERFAAAARIVADRGWKAVRRSELRTGEPLDEAGDVFLLDTVGELAPLYRLADAVFVGGSLVPVGGHNLLEPASWGKPVFYGPHTDHCAEIAEQLGAGGGGVSVRSGEDLARQAAGLLRDRARLHGTGEAARNVILRNRGALERTLELLGTALSKT